VCVVPELVQLSGVEWSGGERNPVSLPRTVCSRTCRKKLLPLSHRNTMQGSRVLSGATAPSPGRDRPPAQTSANITIPPLAHITVGPSENV
jgi:hypothetical protein